jgi:hypothetical protein
MQHKEGHPYALLKNGIIEMIVATDHDEEMIKHIMEFNKCDDFLSLCDPKHIIPFLGGDIYLGRAREPKPVPSWNVFNESTWQWLPPIPYPADNKRYFWNETDLCWVLVVETV